jgi:hypothetical protein
MQSKALPFALIAAGAGAFVTNINGFNRPLNVRFGPDGCAYVVDYGAVRDLSVVRILSVPPMARWSKFPAPG